MNEHRIADRLAMSPRLRAAGIAIAIDWGRADWCHTRAVELLKDGREWDDAVREAAEEWRIHQELDGGS